MLAWYMATVLYKTSIKIVNKDGSNPKNQIIGGSLLVSVRMNLRYNLAIRRSMKKTKVMNNALLYSLNQ